MEESVCDPVGYVRRSVCLVEQQGGRKAGTYAASVGE